VKHEVSESVSKSDGQLMSLRVHERHMAVNENTNMAELHKRRQ